MTDEFAEYLRLPAPLFESIFFN